MADQLVTPAQVKNRLQNAAAGVTFSATDTATITEIIEQVSDWVQHYTGRKFLPITSTTYVFDGHAGSVLRIPIGVRSVSALGIASTGQPDSGGTYTAISAANILLRPATQDLLTGWPPTEIWLSSAQTSYFTNTQNGVSVTGTFGWAACPPDIQAVVIDASVAAFQARQNGASSVIGADGGAIPPWSQFFSKGSPQRGTLDRYRYIGIG